MPSKSNKQKSLEKKKFVVRVLGSRTKISGSGAGFGSTGHRHGSADLDPYQNVKDPQHLNVTQEAVGGNISSDGTD